MVSKQLASVSGSGRFFTCRGKHLANTCAPKCAQPGAAQACKGPRPEAEAQAEAELEAEVEACARCALRVYLGDAPLCVSTPSGHCLLAALAACLPASFV